MVKAGKLGHLVLSVRDCVRSRDFYMKWLGLKIASQDLSRGMIFLTLGDEHHVIALFQRASEDPPTPDQPGIAHMAFQLDGFDELQATHKELKEAGVPVESAVEDDISRGFFIRDPDNYCIEVLCNRGANDLEAIPTSGLSAKSLDIAAGTAQRR